MKFAIFKYLLDFLLTVAISFFASIAAMVIMAYCILGGVL